MYLFIRVLHVVCGALWFGFAVFSAWFLVPLAGDLGPDAAKLARGLQRRGFIVATPVIAGLAILSGIWLYWNYTQGFTPGLGNPHSLMALQIGGGLSILAFLVGALVISRAMRKSSSLAEQAAKTGSDGERATLLQQSAALRQRAGVAGKLVAILLLLTVILMSSALHLP